MQEIKNGIDRTHLYLKLRKPRRGTGGNDGEQNPAMPPGQDDKNI